MNRLILDRYQEVYGPYGPQALLANLKNVLHNIQQTLWDIIACTMTKDAKDVAAMLPSQ